MILNLGFRLYTLFCTLSPQSFRSATLPPAECARVRYMAS